MPFLGSTDHLFTVIKDSLKHQRETIGRFTNYDSIHLSSTFLRTFSIIHNQCWNYRDEGMSYPNQGAHSLV